MRRTFDSSGETISPDELFEQLEYNPDTGKCYWKVSRPSVARGKEAGHHRKNDDHWSIRVFQKDYLRSHVAFALMTGRWPSPGMEMDHINRIPLDDRWINLREATSTHQKLNRVSKKVRVHDLPRGVRRNGRGYQACWSIKHVTKVSPTFRTVEEAKAFRDEKMRELGWDEYLAA